MKERAVSLFGSALKTGTDFRPNVTYLPHNAALRAITPYF
jgi:hypothetical protein